MERGTLEFFSFDTEMKEEKLKKEIEKRARRKGVPKAITVASIENALIAYKGNITDAAKHLGYSNPLSLRQRIRKSKRLQALADELIERVVDLAESKVVKHIEEGNLTAAIFFLKTKGKERGYTEKNTTEHELGPEARKDAAALIEAMRTGAKALPGDDAIDVKEYSTWPVEEDRKLLEGK